MRQYDVIVLGTGGVGSAALYHLAQRRVRALGLDRFPAAHDRGSSHGQTRLIRRAYFEHPDYEPLLELAYALWDDLGEECGEKLFERAGLIYFSPAHGPVVQGLLESGRRHGLELEELAPGAAAREFPGFVVPRDAAVIFDRDAGYLWVEKCIRAHVDRAVSQGAEHRDSETVLGWAVTGTTVTVKTDREAYEASRLIITLGPWARELLGTLGVKLRILRKHMHWFDVADARYQAADGCPCFFYDVTGGYFYGFPSVAPYGLKVAEHSGGTEIPEPLDDRWEPESSDVRRIDRLRAAYLPGVSSRRNRHEVCFYTMSPDGHFIVDRHPEYARVVFAAGLSGHGFKFTSALGSVLVELCLDGSTSRPVGFLGLNRPNLNGC